MKSIHQTIGLFLMGIRDSLSLLWVKKIMFFSKPGNKQIHHSSLKMQKMIINSFIQVVIFLIALPQLFFYIGLAPIYYFLNALFLILSYGWLFFYTDDIMNCTRQVAIWAAQYSQNPFGKLYVKQKIQIFTALSSQIKSFIFLVLYYLPIYLIASKILINIPVIGLPLLLLSEAFFNSAFYFLKLWPYDRYNAGFIEKYWAYMLGYGLFVSIVCNALLSGSFAVGAYLLISQWMIINCILHGPADLQFKTWNDVIWLIPASKRGNAYNNHRQRIRKDEQYRKQMIGYIRFLKPAMIITQYLNKKLSIIMQKTTQGHLGNTKSSNEKILTVQQTSNAADNMNENSHQANKAQ